MSRLLSTNGSEKTRSSNSPDNEPLAYGVPTHAVLLQASSRFRGNRFSCYDPLAMPREYRLLQRVYRKARRPEDLPWYRVEPDPLLIKAVEHQTQPGRALDVGCGAGVFSVWLSQRGWQTTGVDFLEEALSMARSYAAARDANVDFVRADILHWESSQPFDLVLDSGCFHSLNPKHRKRYKEQLLKWLTPGGDYVLIHFNRRHLLDWRLFGPRRRRRAEIVRELQPELAEKAYREQLFKTGLPISPDSLLSTYWFHRT